MDWSDNTVGVSTDKEEDWPGNTVGWATYKEGDWPGNTAGWATDKERDWPRIVLVWAAGKGIGKEPTKIEEGLYEVLRGVLAETNSVLEETSKVGLQEASKGIDKGGELDNEDL